MQIEKKLLSFKVKIINFLLNILGDITEQERIAYAKEREEVEKQVREHLEKMEKIKKEKFEKKKSNQNDLLYQISEKDRMYVKENHDKQLEERSAKNLESEYVRKIAEYKQHQNKKVIYC
jgi:hypothetical protein